MSAFRNCTGKISNVANWELNDIKSGEYDAVKVAKFWWAFADEKSKNKLAAESIKVHAANWYKKAIALNLLSGLEAKIAELRINGCESLATQAIVKEHVENLYMVIDLNKLGDKAVTYLEGVPKGGWSDEYKMQKMVFRKIAPGSFEYMPGRSFKITKPFYIGIFEVTQKQYEMTMNMNPSEFKGDMRPVERVSYVNIRGANKGLNWPKDNKVDADSYLGKLRMRIGLEFDLPTEVQWEYACRAGTKGDFNVDGEPMTKLGKCRDNGGENDHHVKVGSFLPNAWGLYDMHGNVWEWCLDRADGLGWMEWTTDAKETNIDPQGPAAGATRIRRGGRWGNNAHACRSSQRDRGDVGNNWGSFGFRLACPVDSEK